MSIQTTPLRRLFSRFFPKKAASMSLPREVIEGDFLPLEQKKELAIKYLVQGEMALLKGNLKALICFEAATSLDGENPEVWYRQGLAFFEYGSTEGREKALLLASKNFKTATGIQDDFFEAWVAWGNVLLELGIFHEEHHFLIEAKLKYEKAFSLREGKSKEALAELYWDYGIVWSEIAKYSGEAIDVSLAIEAFQMSEKLQTVLSAEFLNDCGNAYLEMGLLINNSRLYIQSVQYLTKAVKIDPNYYDGLVSLAEAYAQLYLITLNEEYVSKASEVYASISKLYSQDPEIWLGWAQILGESGRRNQDAKMLKLSTEKCAIGASLAEDDPGITSQWVESLSLLGLATSRLELIIEAENKIIRAAEVYPDDPSVWLSYGVCLAAFAEYYEDVDYYELAIEKLQNGISLDRSDPELWHALGALHKKYAKLTQDQDLIERACRFLTKALDLKPGCPTLLYDTANAYLEHSEILSDLPSLEQAVLLFEMLLKGHYGAILNHPEWLYDYGRTLEWLGDHSGEEAYFTQAIEVYSHALLIDPDYPNIHHKIALCYAELGHANSETQYYERALNFYRLAHRQDPENEEVWLDWGICLISLAHHTLDTSSMHELYLDAEFKIIQAGLLGSEHAYYSLASLYSIMGRTYEAMELLYKSFQTNSLPSIEEILEDDWLENVRATSGFVQFLSMLEAKMQQTFEE